MFLSILIAWLDAGNLLPRHMLMIFTPLEPPSSRVGDGSAWTRCRQSDEGLWQPPDSADSGLAPPTAAVVPLRLVLRTPRTAV
jgi:hypothetical protein